MKGLSPNGRGEQKWGKDFGFGGNYKFGMLDFRLMISSLGERLSALAANSTFRIQRCSPAGGWTRSRQ